jgi:cell division septation protein DedD
MIGTNSESNTSGLKLSISISVVLIGLVIGSLVAAFVIGFNSGHTTGFEEATRASLASVPRFKIADSEQPQEVSEEFVSRVYDRLKKNVESNEDSSNTPELGVISRVKTPKPERREPEKRQVEKQQPEQQQISVSKEKEKVVEKTIEATTKVIDKPNTLGGLFELGNVAVDKKDEPRLDDVQDSIRTATIPTMEEQANQIVIEKQPKEEAKVATVPPVRQVSPPASTAKEPTTPLRAGWYVQVAAPKSIDEAKSLINQLRENGFGDSSIQSAEVRGELYYRVLVGPEENAVLAQRLLEQLAREPYIKFKPYLKRVQG